MRLLPFDYAIRNLARSPKRLALVIGGSALASLLVLPAAAHSGVVTRGSVGEAYVTGAKAGAKLTLKDPGPSGWITVQGKGRLGKLALQTPAMIRFGAETEDEVYITFEAATRGVEIENNGSEPLVSLRYFGPDAFDKVPNVGDYRRG